MINVWTPNMIRTDSNHVGKTKLKPGDPTRVEARGGGRRRGKPLLGGLFGHKNL
jgi:hypothetical protein